MKNLNYFEDDYQSDVIHNITFHVFTRTPLKHLNINGYLQVIETDAFLRYNYFLVLLFLKLSGTLPALHVYKNRKIDELYLSNNSKKLW